VTNEFKIEKNIPVPPARGKGYAQVLRSLKKGESVVLPIKEGASQLAHSNIGKGNYSCRKVKDGFRIWRIR
jgi:hypothetical protein